MNLLYCAPSDYSESPFETCANLMAGKMTVDVPLDIEQFLGCKTPVSWLEVAADRLPELLVDHAQCEKKAASSAMQLMFRYPDDEEMAKKMSKLAREELRHFEQC